MVMEGDATWVADTQYHTRIQMMYCRVIYLKPIYFYQPISPNKFR